MNPTPIAAYLTAARAATYWTVRGGAQVVLPNTANGPIEVGLAASGSDIVSAGARLNIYPSLVQTIARLPLPAGLLDDLARIFRVAAVVVVKHLLWMWEECIDGDVNIFGVNPVDAYPAADSLAGLTEASTNTFLASITTAEATNAWLIIHATKNNWLLRNHHTGQGTMTGVLLKVAVMLGHMANTTLS